MFEQRGMPGKATRADAEVAESAPGRRTLVQVSGGEEAADDPGEPLPKPLQHKMEASFGVGLGDVRVHQGRQALGLGAKAFARGNHLYFAPGAYDPQSEAGQELIGHELAHVVQQRSGRVQGGQAKDGAVVNADAGLEAEADAAGARAARGQPAGIAAAGSHTVDIAQRTLANTPVSDSKHRFVYQYEKETEDQTPRGTKGTTQGETGHYQHVGGGYFHRVDGGADGKVNATRTYFYFAATGTLRSGSFATKSGAVPVAWEAADQKSGKNSDPIGRADADDYPLAWAPHPSVKSPTVVAEVAAIAKQLGLAAVPKDAPGWTLLPSLPDSPLQLFIRVPPDERQAWTGRATQAEGTVSQVWSQLVARGEKEKASDEVEPVKPATKRTRRPTAKHFDNESARKVWKGVKNEVGKTEYEWCHLIGDGDGGSNRQTNLVVGSRAANTEQLVFESVHRQYREICKKHGLRILIQGRASLVKYPDSSLPEHYKHVADWIRYTITVEHKTSKKRALVLDQVIDAHRDKIAKNATRVLIAQTHMAMRRAIAELGVTPSAHSYSKEAVRATPSKQASASGDLKASAYDQIDAYLKTATTPDALKKAVAYCTAQGFPSEIVEDALVRLDKSEAEIAALLKPDAEASSRAPNIDDALDELRAEALSFYLVAVDRILDKPADPNAELLALRQQVGVHLITALKKWEIDKDPRAACMVDEVLEDFDDHAKARLAERARKQADAKPAEPPVAGPSAPSAMDGVRATPPAPMSAPKPAALSAGPAPRPGLTAFMPIARHADHKSPPVAHAQSSRAGEPAGSGRDADMGGLRADDSGDESAEDSGDEGGDSRPARAAASHGDGDVEM